MNGDGLCKGEGEGEVRNEEWRLGRPGIVCRSFMAGRTMVFSFLFSFSPQGFVGPDCRTFFVSGNIAIVLLRLTMDEANVQQIEGETLPSLLRGILVSKAAG